MTSTSQPRFEPGWTHFTILGLSAGLVGIYSMSALPPGISHIVLKCGIVGAIASLCIGQAAISRAEHKQTAQAKDRVESRLDRVIDSGLTRIDGDVETVPPAPNTIAEPARNSTYETVG